MVKNATKREICPFVPCTREAGDRLIAWAKGVRDKRRCSRRKQNTRLNRVDSSKLKTKCCDCGEPIVWLKTKLGKNIPVNPDSVDVGEKLYDRLRHETHFVTCIGKRELKVN